MIARSMIFLLPSSVPINFNISKRRLVVTISFACSRLIDKKKLPRKSLPPRLTCSTSVRTFIRSSNPQMADEVERGPILNQKLEIEVNNQRDALELT